jgi:hypothetical protein
MLGSNQRPLPCEVRSILSWLFAAVHNRLQNRPFVSGSIHVCSPLFVWVGVLLVYKDDRDEIENLPTFKEEFIENSSSPALMRPCISLNASGDETTRSDSEGYAGTSKRLKRLYGVCSYNNKLGRTSDRTKNNAISRR